MTNRNNQECLKELDEQYPRVAVTAESCTLTFTDRSITLRDISLLSSDSVRHISTYHATDDSRRRCRVIVNCGAEPPDIKIGTIDRNSILVSASITHEKQDELNQNLLGLCPTALEMA